MIFQITLYLPTPGPELKTATHPSTTKYLNSAVACYCIYPYKLPHSIKHLSFATNILSSPTINVLSISFLVAKYVIISQILVVSLSHSNPPTGVVLSTLRIINFIANL